MNYIEFEIGGKLRGFKLGLGFLGSVLKELDTDITGFGNTMVSNPFLSVPTILYCGHYHDCKRKGVPVTFELYDFEDWVEEMPRGVNNENFVGVVNIVVEAIKMHLPQVEVSEEDNSKKK